MKRKSNLYENTYKIENIMSAYYEVCKHTKNKRKARNYSQYKCIYISRIYNALANKTYKVGKYNVFTIYEPKQRRIISQGLHDKVINHIVSRQILCPALLPCLIPENVASRKGMGTKKGLELAYKFHRKCKINFGEYYILKCDIAKYFESINKDILKEKIKRKIKDKDALNIVFEIIDSEEKGLGIGNMTSQILAIFYLNDLDHYIKEVLKIKYYVRYQDDFLLFDGSRKYLQECEKKIKEFIKKEGLQLNKKTRIYKNTDNFIFLGRNKNGKYAKYRTAKRRLKKRYKLYLQNQITLNQLASSIISIQTNQRKI